MTVSNYAEVHYTFEHSLASAIVGAWHLGIKGEDLGDIGLVDDDGGVIAFVSMPDTEDDMGAALAAAIDGSTNLIAEITKGSVEIPRPWRASVIVRERMLDNLLTPRFTSEPDPSPVAECVDETEDDGLAGVGAE